MAAAISALNAKIRSQPILNYVCSTRTSDPHHNTTLRSSTIITRLHSLSDYRFLGPSLKLRHTHRRRHGHAERSRNVPLIHPSISLSPQKPSLFLKTRGFSICLTYDLHIYSISGRMTGALILYSGTFMRYALAVTPKNYLLFGCHFVNFGAQLTQGYRYMQYWK